MRSKPSKQAQELDLLKVIIYQKWNKLSLFATGPTYNLESKKPSFIAIFCYKVAVTFLVLATFKMLHLLVNRTNDFPLFNTRCVFTVFPTCRLCKTLQATKTGTAHQPRTVANDLFKCLPMFHYRRQTTAKKPKKQNLPPDLFIYSTAA